jgi:V/A-type H+/Na+-transporting ATPase subunit D
MEAVTATRSELLARRSRIALASQGRDLLIEQRAALMLEFQRISAEVLGAMRDLERRAAAGRGALAEALALDGPEAVGTAAVAAAGTIDVELSTRMVAGVQLIDLAHPPVGRPRIGRGYAMTASSPRIDAVAEAFERQLDALLDVVGIELTLRRLAAQIASTTRRVNALEHVVIPALALERNFIALVLEERELEDRVRLTRAKNARARGGSSPQVPA